MASVKVVLGIFLALAGLFLMIFAGWIAVVKGVVDFANMMKDPAVTFSFFSVAWLFIKVWGGALLLGLVGLVVLAGGCILAWLGFRR